MRTAAPVAPAHCGLRERKKARTRDAMLRAALELFGSAGYEATTVRQIADAAEVSERTFFRYFTGKEELVLSLVAGATELFIGELRARPARETPMAAMRGALRGALAALRTEQRSDHEFVFGSVVELIERTPQLLAAHLRVVQESGERVARLLAEREGIAEDDPRPQMLQAVFAALVLLAHREWRGHGGIDRLIALTDTYLDGLPALTESWRAPGVCEPVR